MAHGAVLLVNGRREGVESRGRSGHVADRMAELQAVGRGPVRGPGRRIIPAPRVPSVRSPVLSVQLAHAQPQRVPLVMRRWPVSTGVCASFWPRIGASRRGQSSLGYEPYDVRLCRFDTVSALRADLGVRARMLPADLPRLPVLSPSRSVRFTNRFTGLVIDLRVSRSLDACAAMVYPSPVARVATVLGRRLVSS